MLRATLVALLLASCTRMPTAPRAEITVFGTVTEAGGAPLPWALLTFQPRELVLPLHSYTTVAADSLGGYSVTLLEGTYDVDVRPGDGYLPQKHRVTVSRGHERFDVVVGGYKVQGTVRDSEGGIPDRAYVTAQSSDASDEYAISLLDSGAYSFVLPPGTYRLSVSVYGRYPLTQRYLAVASDTTLDIVLDGIRVDGTVTGRGGIPLVEAFIRVADEIIVSETDSSGNYALYAPRGIQRFLVHPDESFMVPYLSGPVTIESPTTLDFDLSGVEWAGEVRESGTGAPVRVWVEASVFGDSWDRKAQLLTDSSGGFRLIVRPGERYDLRVYRRLGDPPELHLPDIMANIDTVFALTVAPVP